MHKFDANARINFYSYIPKSERRNKFDILVLVEKLMNMMMEFYYSLDKSPSWHNIKVSRIKAIFQSLLRGPKNVRLRFIIFNDSQLKILDNIIKKYSKYY